MNLLGTTGEYGALAQLVARLHGMQKVIGSSPICSTIEDVLEHLTSVESGVGVRAAKGSASRIVEPYWVLFRPIRSRRIEL